MAESFNSVLKSIRAMPINAIVSFNFCRLVAWFNERRSSDVKRWHYRGIIRHGHLNLTSTLRRQKKGLSHMTSIVLTTTPASTKSRKGVEQSLMVRSAHYGVILWYFVIFHADMGKPGSTTFHVLIMLQHRNIDYEI
jgi:hypothetical protein